MDSQKFKTPQHFLHGRPHFFYWLKREKAPSNFDFKTSKVIENIHTIRDRFASLADQNWNEKSLHQVTDDLSQELSQSTTGQSSESSVESSERQKAFLDIRRQLNVFLRWAICFGHRGPGLNTTMAVIGREDSLARLQTAIEEVDEILETAPGTEPETETAKT